jgi:hypothetical protein
VWPGCRGLNSTRPPCGTRRALMRGSSKPELTPLLHSPISATPGTSLPDRDKSASGSPCHYLRNGSDRARLCPALVSAVTRPNGRGTLPNPPSWPTCREAAQRGTCNPRTPALAALRPHQANAWLCSFRAGGRSLRVMGAPLPPPIHSNRNRPIGRIPAQAAGISMDLSGELPPMSA